MPDDEPPRMTEDEIRAHRAADAADLREWKAWKDETWMDESEAYEDVVNDPTLIGRLQAGESPLAILRDVENQAREAAGLPPIIDRSETMDVPTAKAEIAQGREDMRAAGQERADAFWQQTINAGRVAQAQEAPQQQQEKIAEPQAQ
jgi:hypothetical protein